MKARQGDFACPDCGGVMEHVGCEKGKFNYKCRDCGKEH